MAASFAVIHTSGDRHGSRRIYFDASQITLTAQRNANPDGRLDFLPLAIILDSEYFAVSSTFYREGNWAFHRFNCELLILDEEIFAEPKPKV
jgi:hypothetical protein